MGDKMDTLYNISPFVYSCGKTVRNRENIPYTVSSESCNVFIFVSKGNAVHEVNGRKRILTQGTVEIIPPFFHQIIYAENEEDTEIFYIYFDLFERKKSGDMHAGKPACTDVPLGELYFVDKPCYKMLNTEFEKAEELVNLIHSSFQVCGKFACLERKSLMLRLLLVFMQAEEIDENIAVSTAEGHVAKAMRYIEKNCPDSSLCAKSVAWYAGLNTEYLSRLFEKQVHMSLSEFIRITRINRAKEMFYVNRKIFDVAEKCGFSSVQSFCRTFKMVEGSTPGEYLKGV